MADKSLSAKADSPCEEKRSNSAEESTGAGTPVSIAALSVQRPSPESETRPPNWASDGSFFSAPAVRSSSQEPMTLPWRQTSATAGRSMSN